MPAKKHDFTATELKAGVMVLVSAAVLVLLVLIIKGVRPPEAAKTFYTTFTDTGGVNKGADVRFGGAKVGRVSNIELDPADHAKIRIAMKVRPDVPVNEKSEAYVTQTSLTADKHLAISTGEPSAPLLKDGATIPGKSGGLFNQADELVRDVRGILNDLKDLMGVKEAKEKEARGEKELVTIATILGNADDTVKKGSDLVGDIHDVVGESRDDLSSILGKIQEIEDTSNKLMGDLGGILTENRENIKGSVGKVHSILDATQPIVERVAKLSDRLNEIASTLQATLDNAKSLSGDTGAMIADNRPLIEDLVLDLRETVRYLKTFSRTLSEQPEAVIRGKNLEGRK